MSLNLKKGCLFRFGHCWCREGINLQKKPNISVEHSPGVPFSPPETKGIPNHKLLGVLVYVPGVFVKILWIKVSPKNQQLPRNKAPHEVGEYIIPGSPNRSPNITGVDNQMHDHWNNKTPDIFWPAWMTPRANKRVELNLVFAFLSRMGHVLLPKHFVENTNASGSKTPWNHGECFCCLSNFLGLKPPQVEKNMIWRQKVKLGLSAKHQVFLWG